MLQRRKRYKNRTILGFKTLAEGVINMAQVGFLTRRPGRNQFDAALESLNIFAVFYVTRRFLTVVTRGLHWSPSSAR
jgi:hypothetical protein